MTLYCPYCLEPYEGPEPRQYSWQVSGAKMTCGKDLCKGRMTAWRAWVRSTNAAAVGGDVNKPTPKAAYRKVSVLNDKAAYVIQSLYGADELALAA